ncbi:hypothetical protein [Streptomyces sp. NPDC053069]|uniref:hypothetical protein n=1 Tax=Streptomyces sp. NPDC053069 TaxID=3365695 RepID=UPI0037D39462
MDAGIAAVLGALAGSVATIGAAMATGWAQREGARIAARSEHQRQRREPRHLVYKEFISKAELVRHRASIYSSLDDGLTPDYVTEQQVNELFEAATEIKAAATEAALVGPKKVTAAALAIAHLGSDLAAYAAIFRDLTEPQHQQIGKRSHRKLVRVAKEYQNSLDNFILRAQGALDDDGSRK